MITESPLKVATIGSKLLEMQDKLRALRAKFPAPAECRSEIRDVVLLCSASRSGSSMVAELLRRSNSFLHLRGEINPLLVLSGHAHPYSGMGSDELDEGCLNAESRAVNLERSLSYDLGQPSEILDGDDDRWRFAVDLSSRLVMQWPHLDVDLYHVQQCLNEALVLLERDEGWRSGRFEDASLFHAVFLRSLRRIHPEIDPRLYDIDQNHISKYHSDLGPFVGAPPLLVEEPPFIAIGPWRPATREDLQRLPVIIKTPSNAYRLPFLRALFPRARLRVLHLTRNVAASVNGLFDGWRHHGFFSHRLTARLSIRGYSDIFPESGTHWWKFDLPPRWSDWVSSPLEEVCLFQWMSAHKTLLRSAGVGGSDYMRLHFEQLVSSPTERRQIMRKVLDWAGAKMDFQFEGALVVPPLVMATHAPRQYRWRQRAPLIEPLLALDEVRLVMQELGYRRHPREWG